MSSKTSKVFVGPTETCSQTYPKIIQVCHRWEIRNFSFCIQDKSSEIPYRSFRSGKFQTTMNDQTVEWSLYCNTTYPEDWCKDYFQAYLCLHGTDTPCTIYVKFNLYVVNAKGERLTPVRTKSSKLYSHGLADFPYEESWTGFDDFISLDLIRNENSPLLSNDSLILKCELFVGEEETHSISVQYGVGQLTKDLTIQSQIKAMYLSSKEFSDVTLVAKGKEFPAHRVILAARSPVFASMFSHKMLEQKENKVKIEDIEPEVLEKMLTFVYTDEVPDLESVVADLLVAADKYDIGNLRKMCENTLGALITMENLPTVLRLSNTLGLNELKGRAMSFITSNIVNLSRTSAWVEMFSRNEDSVHAMCKECTEFDKAADLIPDQSAPQ